MKNLFGEEVKPPKRNQSSHTRLTSWYCKWYWKKFETKCPESFGRFHKTWKELLDQYNEEQVILLIFLHFHWYGPDDRDERQYKFLEGARFPLGLLVKNSPLYKDFAQHVLKIRFDDRESVADYIIKVIHMHKIVFN